MKACLNQLSEKKNYGSQLRGAEHCGEVGNRNEVRQVQNNFGELSIHRPLVVEIANWFTEAWEIPITKSSLLVPTVLARGPDIGDTTTDACGR